MREGMKSVSERVRYGRGSGMREYANILWNERGYGVIQGME